MLTNVVMGGANASFPDFNNFGGNESQPEDLRSLRALNSLWTSFVDTGDNSNLGQPCVITCSFTLAILLWEEKSSFMSSID